MCAGVRCNPRRLPKQQTRRVEHPERDETILAPIWEGRCKILNQLSPVGDGDYLLDQISLVFIGINGVFERSIPLTRFNIRLAAFLFRMNYFLSVDWVDYNDAHGRASDYSRVSSHGAGGYVPVVLLNFLSVSARQ